VASGEGEDEARRQGSKEAGKEDSLASICSGGAAIRKRLGSFLTEILGNRVGPPVLSRLEIENIDFTQKGGILPLP